MRQLILNVKGASNTGKSSTIRTLYKEIVKTANYDSLEIFDTNHKPATDVAEDFVCVFNIRGVLIGLASQGDALNQVKSHFNFLTNVKKAQIIVCATRSRGGSVDFIKSHQESGFEVLLYQTSYKKTEIEQTNANCYKAIVILEKIYGRICVDKQIFQTYQS
ncbi:MAG: hypothetical protein H6R05_1713 [Burkholderiaceae bacterium]|nr:hypothetical protein [Burkholderiaceae bacterium]